MARLSGLKLIAVIKMANPKIPINSYYGGVINTVQIKSRAGKYKIPCRCCISCLSGSPSGPNVFEITEDEFYDIATATSYTATISGSVSAKYIRYLSGQFCELGQYTDFKGEGVSEALINLSETRQIPNGGCNLNYLNLSYVQDTWRENWTVTEGPPCDPPVEETSGNDFSRDVLTLGFLSSLWSADDKFYLQLDFFNINTYDSNGVVDDKFLFLPDYQQPPSGNYIQSNGGCSFSINGNVVNLIAYEYVQSYGPPPEFRPIFTANLSFEVNI
jgi:hypothetical protein